MTDGQNNNYDTFSQTPLDQNVASQEQANTKQKRPLRNKNKLGIIALAIFAGGILAFGWLMTQLCGVYDMIAAIHNLTLFVVLGISGAAAVFISLILSIIGIARSAKLKKHYGRRKGLITSVIALSLCCAICLYSCIGFTYASSMKLMLNQDGVSDQEVTESQTKKALAIFKKPSKVKRNTIPLSKMIRMR